MKHKIPRAFYPLLFLFSTFFLLTHLYAISGNNFHFTTDQGRDAVYIRDVIDNRTLFLKGPETSIRGIFTGPLWYYFLIPGYLLTHGHPIAAPLSLILLNLGTFIYLALWLKKNISLRSSLLVSISLLFFWPFFETSLYGFNPFPSVALAIFQITLLADFFTTHKRKFYFLSLIPLILSFNTNLAIALVFTIFQIFVLIALKLKPKLELWPQAQAPLNFPYLTLFLALTSIIFFTLSPIYRSWYTVYLPPLLLISLIIAIVYRPSAISKVILSLVFITLIINFTSRYLTYLKPSSDPSLLYNQLAVVNQIYQSANKNGFAAYNYTDTFFDYPYQYLFYWYGLAHYEYLPCEYANYPLSPKELYIPNFQTYLEPKRSCDRLKFLIIQSQTNGEDNTNWIDTFRNHHRLNDQFQVGKTTIEKYEVTPSTPTDFCLWWQACD